MGLDLFLLFQKDLISNVYVLQDVLIKYLWRYLVSLDSFFPILRYFSELSWDSILSSSVLKTWVGVLLPFQEILSDLTIPNPGPYRWDVPLSEYV